VKYWGNAAGEFPVVSEDDMLGKNIRESTEPVAGCSGLCESAQRRHFLYFDNMSHEWTMKFNEHRVADRRILRLIRKWLKAGVSEDGQWSETKLGTPQGAVVSPPLANVYLHYAFDLRGEAWRKKVAKGDVIIVRYADDLVLGFQHRAEAERFLADYGEEANGGQAQPSRPSCNAGSIIARPTSVARFAATHPW